MATSGHVLRSSVLFLIFYTFTKPHSTQNPEETRLSISDDHICSFYIASDLISSTFKDLQPVMPKRTTGNEPRSISSSKQFQTTIFLVQHILLAEICSSLFILSCGDILPNPGPNDAAPRSSLQDSNNWTSKRGIVIAHLNVRGLRSSIDELKIFTRITL